jgi:hypothetical protein
LRRRAQEALDERARLAAEVRAWDKAHPSIEEEQRQALVKRREQSVLARPVAAGSPF